MVDPHTPEGERIGMSRYCDYLESRIAYLEGELRRIAHGNWRSPEIDSASARTYAQIAAEMRSIATMALGAIVSP